MSIEEHLLKLWLLHPPAMENTRYLKHKVNLGHAVHAVCMGLTFQRFFI